MASPGNTKQEQALLEGLRRAVRVAERNSGQETVGQSATSLTTHVAWGNSGES
jgi:hypothetical protein